jgi:uncharacterized phage-associated protein
MAVLTKNTVQKQPYSSIAVANWFIDNLEGVTPLKLQKLIYYAHGWNLALRDEPLIDELVEAWEYGPVVPRVYHEFKEYGNRVILTRGTEIDLLPDSTIPIGQRAIFITPLMPQSDSRALQLVRKIVDVYGKYTGGQLSTMTHQPGTPWFEIHQEFPNLKNVDIPNRKIKDYFRARIKRRDG